MRLNRRAITVCFIVLMSLFVFRAAAQDPSPAATPQAPATIPSSEEKKPSLDDMKKVQRGPAGMPALVALPPAPLLDEEGKQRLDPEGKPMFLPPILQQRDKKGRPLFDDSGKPVMQTAKELGYDERGKRIRIKKEKSPKAKPVSIVSGVMTVDGYTGKAALNYDIADLKYMYLYAPGIGIAVVSPAAFPGATEQPGAFNDKTLTVVVEGHTLQVASEKRLLGKKPEAAFVAVDRAFTLPSTFPVMGYGATNKPPYAWPGAKPNQDLAGPVKAPPIPKNLLPVQLLAPCPTGQMRKAGPSVLPGKTVTVQPCLPISRGPSDLAPASRQ